MTKSLLFGDIVSDRTLIPDGAVLVEGDRIQYAGDRGALPLTPGEQAEATRLNSPEDRATLVPGLIDVHNHGAFGHDFPTGDEAGLRESLQRLHAGGTTTLLASTVTQPREETLRVFATLAMLAEEGLIAGIHSEGPFISAKHPGAQNPAYIRTPDASFVQDMIQAARGRLVSMTLAPEEKGAQALIDLLCSHDILPSFGHTDAPFEVLEDAVGRADERLADWAKAHPGQSARLRPTITHLFNGMNPMHHRDPGAVAAGLHSARLGNAVAELIGDGIHLAPNTLLSVFDLVGAQNLTLVSDSMAAAGLQDGRYVLGGLDVVVSDGAARLASNGSLAGGTALLIDVVRSVVHAGVPLPDAVYSATQVPSTVLGLQHELGRLAPGYRADILVLGEDFSLNNVIREGQLLNKLRNNE